MKTILRNKTWGVWKPNLPLLGTMLIALLLAACGKDDAASSPTELLVGQWTLDEINGDNISSSFIVEVTFEADGDYEEDINDSGELERYTGTWEWNTAQNEITIDYDQPFNDWELDVDELSATVLELDDGNSTYLFTKD